MQSEYYSGNRKRLYAEMDAGSLLVIFSGKEIRKTNDEYYPFYAERNFVYLTGLSCKEAVLIAEKVSESTIRERLYILPPDAHAERWTGRRVKPKEATDISGIGDIRSNTDLMRDFHALAVSGRFERVYLDLFRVDPADRDRPAQEMSAFIRREYPYLSIGNASSILKRLRLIKQPCEIEAMRKAETITRAGILAMMHASKPGMYEYQYKAEWDRAIQQYGPDCQAFPPIISGGKNNFCIHYYSYTGRVDSGDMVLNDVGAQWDNLMTDVSRGWPCNGHFTADQKRVYDCVLRTSDHLFSIIRPGMEMAAVDRTTHSYNAVLLTEAGLLEKPENVNELMWHNGAHHVGYDVHDVVETPVLIAPGMVFCVDIGVYDERSGIGFRLEDNCLVTENGCENLSAAIPRTIEAIEDEMCRHS